MSRFGARLRGSLPVSSWLTGGGVRLRSIQRGTIALNAAQTSNTATITAVDPANSVLIYLGFSSAAPAVSQDEINARVAFTNATTITGSHDTAGQAVTISFEVLEYWPGVIKAIQRGTITISAAATTGTATISATPLDRASLFSLGHTANTAATAQFYTCDLRFTNTTTITATRVGTTGSITAGYQVVEWR